MLRQQHEDGAAMVDIATVTAAIGAASAGVQLIDKIADQVTRFLRREEPGVPAEHRLTIAKEGADLVARDHGRVQQRITGKDLANLPEADLRHIRVREASMQNHYDIWAAVYPQLALAIDPIAKAKIEAQLRGIVRTMKDDLLAILAFLENAGLQLDDHGLGDEDVNDEFRSEPHVFVDQWNGHLPPEGMSTKRQFVAQAFFVHRLQQPGSEGAMHLDRRSDDRLR